MLHSRHKGFGKLNDLFVKEKALKGHALDVLFFQIKLIPVKFDVFFLKENDTNLLQYIVLSEKK